MAGGGGTNVLECRHETSEHEDADAVGSWRMRLPLYLRGSTDGVERGRVFVRDKPFGPGRAGCRRRGAGRLWRLAGTAKARASLPAVPEAERLDGALLRRRPLHEARAGDARLLLRSRCGQGRGAPGGHGDVHADAGRRRGPSPAVRRTLRRVPPWAWTSVCRSTRRPSAKRTRAWSPSRRGRRSAMSSTRTCGSSR